MAGNQRSAAAHSQSSYRRVGRGRRRQLPTYLSAVGLLSILMLLVACVAVALPSEDDREATITAGLSEPPQASRGVELESKRTATSQTFLLPSGAMETKIFASPIHYRDGDGHWAPIDEGL